MPDIEKTSKVLEDLIQVCRDGENGYREAAEHITSSELRAFFNDQSLERARFARELASELGRLKGDRFDTTAIKGTFTGKMERTWLDVKANLTGSDRTVLESVERGEDRAKEQYQKALSEGLPEAVLGTIRTQAQLVTAAHDHVKLLLDEKLAA